MPRVGPERGEQPTGEALREAIRRGVVHYYHPVGTCAMGTVTNANGAVTGAENLYVADCSIIPTIPRANTNVPAAVVGLRVAEAILGALARSARYVSPAASGRRIRTNGRRTATTRGR